MKLSSRLRLPLRALLLALLLGGLVLPGGPAADGSETDPLDTGPSSPPRLALRGPEVVIESQVEFAGDGARTMHSLALPGGVSPYGATLELTVVGEFGYPSYTASAESEGIDLGQAGESGRDCAPATAIFELNGDELLDLAADGRVEIEVRNAPGVGAPCAANQHRLRLAYHAAADQVTFDEAYVGAVREQVLHVENAGGETLEVSAAVDAPEFSTPDDRLIVGPGEIVPLRVRFLPSESGTFHGGLLLDSNDPDLPFTSLDLEGTAGAPPLSAVDPAALPSAVFEEGVDVQTLTISNPGAAPLQFSLYARLSTVQPPALCTPTTLATVSPLSGSLSTIETATGGVAELLAGLSSPQDVAFDPHLPDIYVLEAGTGSLTVVTPNGPGFGLPFPLGLPAGIAVSRDGTTAWVTDNGSGTLWSVELATGVPTVVATGLLGPRELAVPTIEDTAYVIDGGGSRLVAVDLATGAVTPIGSALSLPVGIALSPDEAAAFVTEAGAGALVTIDLATGLKLPVAGGLDLPVGVVLDPAGGRAFVTEFGANGVTAVDLGTGFSSLLAFGPTQPFGLDGVIPPGCRGEFLSFSPASGSVPAGGSVNVAVTFDAAGLPAGSLFDADIILRSDDPLTPESVIPASLSITGAPDIEIPREVVQLQSAAEFLTPGGTTVHTIPVSGSPAAEGSIELILDGNWETAFQTASLSAEGIPIGVLGNTGIVCGTAQRTFRLTGDLLASLTADGAVQMAIQNSSLVSNCPTNRHTVLLRYEVDADDVDFGFVFTGQSANRSLMIRNAGSENLTVAAVTSDLPEFTPTATTPFTLAPGVTAAIGLEFTPSALGSFDGTLTIESDDPDEPVALVSLAGVGAIPPIVGVQPPQLAVDVLAGTQVAETLTVSNSGGSPLSFSISITGGTTSILSVSPSFGTVPAGGSTDLSVSFDAAGLAPGTFQTTVNVATNDPVTPAVPVPATMTVFDLPDIGLGGDIVELESSADFFAAGWNTTHSFPLPVPPVAGATLELDANGDFGDTSETATVSAEGQLVGIAGESFSVPNCTPVVESFPIDAARMSLLATDGKVDVFVQNSAAVAASCAVNRHTVRLQYAPPLDLDFGPVPIGFEKQRMMTVFNTGRDILNVSSISGDLPEFSVSASAFSVGPGGSVSVTVSFLPSSVSPFDATLTVVSDDPDEGTLTIAMTGEGVPPPVITVAPSQLTEVLGTFLTSTQTLTIGNTGQSDLEWSAATGLPSWLAVEPTEGTVPPGGSQGVTVRFSSGPATGTFQTDLTLASNDPASTEVVIPVTFEVFGVPDIALSGKETTLVSSESYTTSGAETSHAFAVAPGSAVRARLELVADGDYGSLSETATAEIEGTTLGSTTAAGADCTPATGEFDVDVALLAAATADGAVDVTIQNSLSVNVFCAANNHLVRLVLDGQPDLLEFGPVFEGGSRAVVFEVANLGTDDLAVMGISSDLPEITVAPSSFILPPGTFQPVTAVFAPTAVATFGGTLTIESDDPDEPALALPVHGEGIPAPVVEVSPASLSEALFSGGTSFQLLAIGNTGGSNLTWELRGEGGALAPWLGISPRSGSVGPGGSTQAVVSFDAAGLFEGVYSAGLEVRSNDPLTPSVTIPVTLSVTGAPDLLIEGTESVLESVQDFTTDGAVTNHGLAILEQPGFGGVLEVVADGDFGFAGESAVVSVEGVLLGQVGGDLGVDCAPATGDFDIDTAQLAAFATDGVVNVTVDNGFAVNVFCAVNRHTVRLRYRGSADELNFGSLFVGLSRAMTFQIRNIGTKVLIVSSLSTDQTEFASSPSSASVAPGTAQLVEVTFAPAGLGPVDGLLTIVSDDPDSPTTTVQLHGVGLDPPVVDLSPAGFSSVADVGSTDTQTLTVGNLGSNPLEFSLEGIGLVGPRFSCPASMAYVAVLTGSAVSAVDIATGLSTPLASLETPADLALNGAGDTLYVTQAPGHLAGVDIATGSASPIASGLGQPVGLALSPAESLAYVAESDTGMISAVDLATGAVTMVASGFTEPVDIALDASGTTGYVVDLTTGELSAVDLASGLVTNVASGLDGPASLVLSNDGTTAYVAEFAGGSVASVDLSTGTITPLISGLNGPRGTAIVPGGEALYLTVESFSAGDLGILDLATRNFTPLGVTGLGLSYGLTVVVPDECPTTFLRFDPSSGTVPAFGSLDVDVTFDATALLGGDYDGAILAHTNDPQSPEVRLPATLHVTGTPQIAVTGERVTVESVLDYALDGATTVHPLPVGMEFAGAATIELVADGDYGFPGETAALWVEGEQLGVVGGGTGVDCIPAAGSFGLSPSDFAVAAADGIVQVEVRNSPEVNVFCAANQHAVRLSYSTPAIFLDFGALFVGLSSERIVEVWNLGTETLDVTSVSADRAEFTASLASFTVEPGKSRVIVVEFTPTTAGLVDGTLGIASNDPSQGVLSIELSGIGRVPPVISVSPGAFQEMLAPGGMTTRTMQITNTGGNPLDYEIGLQTPNETAMPGFVIFADDMEGGQSGWSHSATGGSVDLWSLSTSRAFSGIRSWNVAQHAGAGSDALVSPPIDLGGTFNARLNFRHFYDFDDCGGDPDVEADGGIVEVSADDGATWTQVFPDGGYPYILDDICSNPLAYLPAYSHVSAGAWLPAGFDLSAFVGGVVHLRFHAGWDCGNCAFNEGWYIDDVEVVSTTPPWITITPLSGTVAPGVTADVTIDLDATDVPAGTLASTLIVASNDPVNPAVPVPVTLVVNNPPQAAFVTPLPAQCTVPAGAPVALDGSASVDPDSTPGSNDDIVLFEWIEDLGGAGEVLLGTGEQITATLALGDHDVSLRVTDSAGASDSVTATVTVQDTQGPSLIVTTDPAVLWPPHHELVPVAVSWTVSDLCDPFPAVELVGGVSSEDDDADGNGDGSTTGDVAGLDPWTPDTEVSLRRERDGTGPGRTYVLTYVARDASGNETAALAVVAVPHDMAAGTDPLQLSLAPATGPGAAHIYWSPVAGAGSYDVITGPLSAVRVADGVLDLGAVRVVVAGTTGTSVDEGAGALLPAVGEAAFYLVQYRTARGGQGYGSETAPWPRQPASCAGGCP